MFRFVKILGAESASRAYTPEADCDNAQATDTKSISHGKKNIIREFRRQRRYTSLQMLVLHSVVVLFCLTRYIYVKGYLIVRWSLEHESVDDTSLTVARVFVTMWVCPCMQKKCLLGHVI